MCAGDEVSRSLRRAADPRELEHALGLHAHFVHRVDYAFRNGIVAAPGAERRLAASIIDHLQPETVGLWRGGLSWGARHKLPAFLGNYVVGHGTRVDRQTVEVAHA